MKILKILFCFRFKIISYGVTGARETSEPLIGFDMGGTSTDVSRFDGKYQHVVESTTANVTIQAPQLDINTVAAGGGSMLFFRSGLFVVGPESAGAHPGPACYRKGGPLTVTDANLVLGRLLPEYFPKIFGPNEDQPLDIESSLAKFKEMQHGVNEFLINSGQRNEPLSVEEIAMGFIRVANESMCRPIRALTQARGYDTSKHVLACFGGAGGQHACSIARELGMAKIVVHKYAGILSAYGMALADVVEDRQEPCGLEYAQKNMDLLRDRLKDLEEKCRAKLLSQGFSTERIAIEPFLHMRYDGTDSALMCAPNGGSNRTTILVPYGDFEFAFLNRYRSEYGFTLGERKIIVDDIRIRASGKSDTPNESEIESATGEPPVDNVVDAYFDSIGKVKVNVYVSTDLRRGHILHGPAILIDKLSTILIEPNCRAEVTKAGDLIVHVSFGANAVKTIGTSLDAVQLSIFSHRFMSIAEQMGRVLQRTSISTNIKERLDFSCALFGPDGGLVSNAPHIPVHLGAMQETVQYQLKVRGDTLRPGDVLLSNHPQAGGSHLPDLTVITPVFYK